MFDSVSSFFPKELLDNLIKRALKEANILTSEEFNIQQKVLLKTRAKIEDLEQQVSKLEQQLNIN